jgi:hypothetical protein
MKRLLGELTVLVIAICGCAHIEGTRDKSSTFQRSRVIAQVDSIAILPIQEEAGMPGLSARIETGLSRTLQAQFTNARIIDAPAAGSIFAQRDLVTIYGQWRSGYEFTGILDPKSFDAISQAIGARYLLVVHQPHLSREKARGSDTGYTGLVADANNVWRTDLRFTAELIDTQAKFVAWKGDGHAERIHSPKKDTDLFFVVLHDRNPEMPEYIAEMVVTATRGLALQIGSGASGMPSQMASAAAMRADPPRAIVPPPPTPARTTASIIPPAAAGSSIRCPSLGADLTKLAVTSMGIDGVTGAMISGVSPTGAAASAGIRKGDIVIRVGDSPINDPADVQDAICQIPAGTTIDVKLSRQAQPMWVSVRF